jgi:hypothetical protein
MQRSIHRLSGVFGILGALGIVATPSFAQDGSAYRGDHGRSVRVQQGSARPCPPGQARRGWCDDRDWRRTASRDWCWDRNRDNRCDDARRSRIHDQRRVYDPGRDRIYDARRDRVYGRRGEPVSEGRDDLRDRVATVLDRLRDIQRSRR